MSPRGGGGGRGGADCNNFVGIGGFGGGEDGFATFDEDLAEPLADLPRGFALAVPSDALDLGVDFVRIGGGAALSSVFDELAR